MRGLRLLKLRRSIVILKGGLLVVLFGTRRSLGLRSYLFILRIFPRKYGYLKPEFACLPCNLACRVEGLRKGRLG